MWGEAEFLEKLSDIARMKVDAEPLGNDAFEVEPTPAHDPVLLTIRTRLDYLRELSPLLRRKFRRYFITKAEQADQMEHIIAAVVGYKRTGMTLGRYSGEDRCLSRLCAASRR